MILDSFLDPDQQHQRQHSSSSSSSSSSSPATTTAASALPPSHSISNIHGATESNGPATEPQRKKKLNRKLASCSACRRRRTRCDRILPCSECAKRNCPCDYHGASEPTVRIPDNEKELRDRIKHLESQLQLLQKPAASFQLPQTNAEVKQDFTADDLAQELSMVTIGQRVQYDHRHPLNDHFRSIIASRLTPIPLAGFDTDECFTLNLVQTTPIPSLRTLIAEHLPTPEEFSRLSIYYYSTLNIWSPAINVRDFSSQVEKFWNMSEPIRFTPHPSPPEESDTQSIHRLAHFVSCILAVCAHGLFRLADIHHLEPATPSSSPSTQSSSSTSHTPAASNPTNPQQGSPPEFRNLTQAQKICLANRWMKLSLGLLTGQEGQIFTKPTVFGIRAMSMLSNIELAPENLDRGIFFWDLTTKSATKLGLCDEPPLAPEEDLDMVDESELESRRHLVWTILSLDWAGVSIGGGIRYCCDRKWPIDSTRWTKPGMTLLALDMIASRYTVKIPGTVESSSHPIDKNDGWPVDPLACLRKVAAHSDVAMQRAAIKIFSGNQVTYHEFLEIERQITDVEELVPRRFQAVISGDGKSIEPEVPTNSPALHILCMFLAGRLSIAKTRLHRLFIVPKNGVSPDERRRHIEALLFHSRRHFLVTHHFPHSLNMHPLMLYSLLNSAIACALVFVKDRDYLESTKDYEFFMPEFERLIQVFDLGQRTIASSLAKRSITMLMTLVELIKSARQLVFGTDDHQTKKIRKEGAGLDLEVKFMTGREPRAEEKNDEEPRRKARVASLSSSSSSHGTPIDRPSILPTAPQSSGHTHLSEPVTSYAPNPLGLGGYYSVNTSQSEPRVATRPIGSGSEPTVPQATTTASSYTQPARVSFSNSSGNYPRTSISSSTGSHLLRSSISSDPEPYPTRSSFSSGTESSVLRTPISSGAEIHHSTTSGRSTAEIYSLRSSTDGGHQVHLSSSARYESYLQHSSSHEFGPPLDNNPDLSRPVAGLPARTMSNPPNEFGIGPGEQTQQEYQFTFNQDTSPTFSTPLSSSISTIPTENQIGTIFDLHPTTTDVGASTGIDGGGWIGGNECENLLSGQAVDVFDEGFLRSMGIPNDFEVGRSDYQPDGSLAVVDSFLPTFEFGLNYAGEHGSSQQFPRQA